MEGGGRGGGNISSARIPSLWSHDINFSGRESKARELMTLPWININAQYANGNTPLILAIQGELSLRVYKALGLP